MASKAEKARFGRYDVVAVKTRSRRQVAIVYWSKNEKSWACRGKEGKKNKKLKEKKEEKKKWFENTTICRQKPKRHKLKASPAQMTLKSESYYWIDTVSQLLTQLATNNNDY